MLTEATPAHSPTSTPMGGNEIGTAGGDPAWSSAGGGQQAQGSEPSMRVSVDASSAGSVPECNVPQADESAHAAAANFAGRATGEDAPGSSVASDVGLLVSDWEARAAIPAKKLSVLQPSRPWTQASSLRSQDSDAGTPPGDPLSPATFSESAASSRQWSASSSVDDDWSPASSGGLSSWRSVRPSRAERRRMIEERIARAESEVRATRARAANGDGRSDTVSTSSVDHVYMERLQQLRGSNPTPQTATYRSTSSTFTSVTPEPESEPELEPDPEPAQQQAPTGQDLESEENGHQEQVDDSDRDEVLEERRPSPRARDIGTGASSSAMAGVWREAVPPEPVRARSSINRGTTRSPERLPARSPARQPAGMAHGPTTPTVDTRSLPTNVGHRWSPAASPYAAGRTSPWTFATEAERREMAQMEHGLECLVGWSPMAASSSPKGMCSAIVPLPRVRTYARQTSGDIELWTCLRVVAGLAQQHVQLRNDQERRRAADRAVRLKSRQRSQDLLRQISATGSGSSPPTSSGGWSKIAPSSPRW